MGRRRKLVELEQNITVIEGKASNSEMKSGVEKLHLHADNSNAMEAMNVINHLHQICNGVEHEMNSRVGSVIVRRSNRIKSLASPTDSLRIEPVVEHVNLVEDEKEQEPEVQQGSVPPEVNVRNLEEKVDYLVRAADDFKSKVYRRQDEGPCPEISYKSLYIDSQKKIEALMEENYNLVRKLEFARGKIAAYEVMKNVVGAPKEVILVSALGKATDITASLSPQAVEKCAPPPPAASPHGADDPKPKKMYRKADDPKPMKTYKKQARR